MFMFQVMPGDVELLAYAVHLAHVHMMQMAAVERDKEKKATIQNRIDRLEQIQKDLSESVRRRL